MSSLQDAERDIVRRVREEAREWFPGADRGDPQVRLEVISDRPTCRLYGVSIGRDAPTPQVVAKVRRDGRTPPRDVRPRLSNAALSAAELSALEFAALQTIAEAVEGDDRFRAVRPLAHLPDHATILLDFVPGTTLRDALMGRCRVRLSRDGPDGLTPPPWPRVGAWLSAFQGSAHPGGRPARQGRREEILERFDAYGRFLEERLGPRPAELARRGSQLAGDALPDPVPLATGHGDFAPRNMFVCPDGRLAVFDPLARWAVPAYEDLGRFLVGVRLLGLQVHSHGLAFSARFVDTIEAEVIAAFRADVPVPSAALRSYQLLLLLDRWAALLADPSPGWPGRARRTSLVLASSYIRRQGLRVLESAAA